MRRYHQAVGYFRVANRGMRGEARQLLVADWFHSLLSLNFSLIVAVVFFLYVASIFIYAVAYVE